MSINKTSTATKRRLTKRRLLQNVDSYKMSTATKRRQLQNVDCYKMLTVTKCFIIWDLGLFLGRVRRPLKG